MQLAQVNVARLLARLDSPQLADFVAALGPVNALADAAPGFVWRLQAEDGDATAIRVFDDDALIVNLSVWTSSEALAAFVYGSAHVDVLRRRGEWSSRPHEHAMALWWMPDGHRPTPSEARERLEHLREHGPGERAFTFSTPFEPPDRGGRPGRRGDGWLCPA